MFRQPGETVPHTKFYAADHLKVLIKRRIDAGDIRGAIRILTDDEKLAEQNEQTMN